ncbi:MAG: hypothetical protein ACI9B9_001662 [Halioglobus sp.]|jgi:hypothetical protein
MRLFTHRVLITLGLASLDCAQQTMSIISLVSPLCLLLGNGKGFKRTENHNKATWEQ